MPTTQSKKNWAEQVADLLHDAAKEIGQLEVQLALGKAEVRDQYEKLKKELRKEFSKNGSVYQAGKKQFAKMEALFDELLVQAALGKADTLDAFDAQKKKIQSALNKIERDLASLSADDTFKIAVRSLLEKTRVKLDILRMHYRYSYNADANAERIAVLKDRIRNIKDNADLNHKMEELEKEIEAAYSELKSAFK